MHLFVTAHPLDPRTGGGELTRRLLARMAQPPDAVVEFTRQDRHADTVLQTLRWRPLPVWWLLVLQALLPWLPFEFHSRLRPAVLRHLRGCRPTHLTLNFTQAFALGLWVPGAQLHCIVHDVVYDAWRSGPRHKAWYAPVVRWWEGRLLRALARRGSHFSCLSRRDQALLHTLYDIGAEVIDLPGLFGRATGAPIRPFPAFDPAHSLRAGFIAAWSRPENWSGLQAFVEALPGGPVAHPRLTLSVAGAGLDTLPFPLPAGYQPLGFVDDLDAYLHSLDLLLVPLDRGAGVKIKVVQAVAAGTPLLISAKAAEGIDFPEGYPVQIVPGARDVALALDRLLRGGRA